METPKAMQRIAAMCEAVGASSCFGPATVVGDRAMVPAAEAMFGFGFGWGGQEAVAAVEGGRAVPAGGGAGVGGGARSRGVAVIEVGPDGVRVHPIHDATAITLARVALALVAVTVLGRVLLGLSRGR